MVACTTWYKVIIVDIGIFESRIVDERHFSSAALAGGFAETQNKKGLSAMIVEMAG